MDIVFVINDKYLFHAMICMTSILENQNRDQNISFHVLHSSVTKKQQRQMQRLGKRYGSTVFFYDLSDYDCSDFVLTIPHITIETYYKVFIPSVLKHLKKALYLDVDMIIDGPLDDLWAVDLGRNYAGVVLDPHIVDGEHLKALDHHGSPYFNAGMMLLNIAELQTINLHEKAIEVLKQYQENIVYQEQDVLNIIFKDKCVWLDPKYNFLMAYYLNDDAYAILNRYSSLKAEAFEAQKKDPIVIHYTGRYKPWHVRCISPKKDLYFHYAKHYWGPLRSMFFHGVFKIKYAAYQGLRRLKKALQSIIKARK